MADAGANAYLSISRTLASQDREVVKKIAALIWVRMAILPEPPGVHGLSNGDLILLFRRMTTSFEDRDLTEFEIAAQEADGLPVGDFWAACVYISMLILDQDSDCMGYVVDRYISFLEKIFLNEYGKIDHEVDLIMKSIADCTSGSTASNGGLLEYVRQSLSV